MKPGVALIAHGGIGVDKVYVAEGTVVSAVYLGASSDEIYLRGTWADYAKSIAGTTLVFSRTVNGTTESVTVAAGASALDDTLIFADGAVGSLSAKSALETNPTVPITGIAGYVANRTTPGVGPELKHQALDNVTNLDPTSNLVLQFTVPVTAVAGKAIRIVDDGGFGPDGSGFRGESRTFSHSIPADDTSRVTVQGNRVTINPSYDLDLATKYHIEIDEGAFVSASGKPSEAFDGTSTLNFSTVTPGQAALAQASASRKFNAAGVLVDSYKWLDIEGIGSKAGSKTNLELSAQSVALVFRDYSSQAAGNPSTYDGVGAPTFWVGAVGFGGDDLVYIDDQFGSNDLSKTIFLNTGAPPTEIQFVPSPSSSLGGYIDVTLVGSTQVFTSVSEWMQKLGSTVPPMISG
jgi:hypothetical protein